MGLGVSLVLICFAPDFWLFLIFCVLGSFSSTFVFPTMTTLTTNRVLPGEIGVLMGVSTALTSLMNIAGPLSAGVVFDAINPTAPYLVCAVVFALAAYYVTREKSAQVG
jgi:MFS family permease